MLLDIHIRKSDFVVNGHSYATTAELTTALKKLPSPDVVNLVHAEGATPERTNEAIAAVKNAGVKAPIGWVGNEVFYQALTATDEWRLRVPDELWSLIAAHLPVHPPSPKRWSTTHQ